MRILMLGNSFTSANGMPRMLATLTGAKVAAHTRGGARLSEHLNPRTRLGARTQAALREEHWDYVVLQEMSHGPITSPTGFFSSMKQLCTQIAECGATPVLYATWAYQEGGSKLTAKGWDYDQMAKTISQSYHLAARENHALIADVGARFYQLSEKEALYAGDGVHPNAQGSRVAAEALAAAILAHERSLPDRRQQGLPPNL